MGQIQQPADLFGLNPDGLAERLKCDQYASLVAISPEHYWIHQGLSYEAGFLWSEGTAIADNANADFLIEAGAGMHAIFEIAVGGDCEVRYYRNPTFSIPSPSDIVTPHNKNDYSTNISASSITANPTITDAGSLVVPKMLPGGGIFGTGAIDGGFSRETILKAGDDYLVRVTNRSGAATQISITAEWYEPS